MGEIKIKISNEIENLFRKIAMRRFGYQRGSISEAAQEAINQWTASYEELEEEAIDPIESIAGMLKNVKKTSVELQHEAWDYLVKKNAHRR